MLSHDYGYTFNVLLETQSCSIKSSLDLLCLRNCQLCIISYNRKHFSDYVRRSDKERGITQAGGNKNKKKNKKTNKVFGCVKGASLL